MGWFKSRTAFLGKAIAVYCGAGEGAMLREARVEWLSGRPFIVGEHAPREVREWTGIPCWIALDDVIKILVFEDIETAKRYFTKGEAEQ